MRDAHLLRLPVQQNCWTSLPPESQHQRHPPVSRRTSRSRKQRRSVQLDQLAHTPARSHQKPTKTDSQLVGKIMFPKPPARSPCLRSTNTARRPRNHLVHGTAADGTTRQTSRLASSASNLSSRCNSRVISTFSAWWRTTEPSDQDVVTARACSNENSAALSVWVCPQPPP